MTRDLLARDDSDVRLAELRQPEDDEFWAHAAETPQLIWHPDRTDFTD